MNFGAYLTQRGGFAKQQAPLRAQVQWARIQDKDFQIEFLRNGIKMPAQTVRVELNNSASDNVGASGDSSSRGAIVFGIHGHPTLPDTDVQVWDTFVLHEMEYSVNTVNRLAHGQVQAMAEAVG